MNSLCISVIVIGVLLFIALLLISRELSSANEICKRQTHTLTRSVITGEKMLSIQSEMYRLTESNIKLQEEVNRKALARMQAETEYYNEKLKAISPTKKEDTLVEEPKKRTPREKKITNQYETILLHRD